MFDHKTTFPQLLAEAFDQAVSSVYAHAELAEDDENLYGLDGIFSTIYLKGDLIGKISIFIRASSAAKVVARMLGVDNLHDDSHETLDGVGEILNILVGCFKQRLEPHQFNLDISVPSTRMTGVIPPSRWENTISEVFSCQDVYFKVIMSYRIASKEDKAVEQEMQPKKKLSAADLLRAALAKK